MRLLSFSSLIFLPHLLGSASSPATPLSPKIKRGRETGKGRERGREKGSRIWEKKGGE